VLPDQTRPESNNGECCPECSDLIDDDDDEKITCTDCGESYHMDCFHDGGGFSCSGMRCKRVACGECVEDPIDVNAKDPIWFKEEQFCNRACARADLGAMTGRFVPAVNPAADAEWDDDDDADDDEDEDDGGLKIVQCRGMTQAGLRCKVTSEMEFRKAEPLQMGSKYCEMHKDQE
jgi:hypothetical protein